MMFIVIPIVGVCNCSMFGCMLQGCPYVAFSHFFATSFLKNANYFLRIEREFTKNIASIL